MIRKLPVKKIVEQIKADPDFNMHQWGHCLTPAIVRAAGGKIKEDDIVLAEPLEFDGLVFDTEQRQWLIWDVTEAILTHLGADKDEVAYVLPFVTRWPQRYQKLVIEEAGSAMNRCPKTAIKFIKWWWVNNLTK